MRALPRRRGALRRAVAGRDKRDDTRGYETRRNETIRDGAGRRVARETRRSGARPVERSRVKSSRVESEGESVAGDSSGRQVCVMWGLLFFRAPCKPRAQLRDSSVLTDVQNIRSYSTTRHFVYCDRTP